MATVEVPLNTADINAFIRQHPPRTTFKFRAGIYRPNAGIIPRTGDELVGTYSAGKRVSVISGAKVLTGWQWNGRAWFANDQMQQGSVHPDPGICLTTHPRCIYPEDLFMDDELKKHVPFVADVEPGTWHFDYTNNRIYVGDNPFGRFVETSVQPYFFGTVDAGTSRVLMDGLIIEKYACPTQNAAVYLGSSYIGALEWEARACEVRYCHGAGIWNDAQTRTLHCYVHHNGCFGLCGAGWDIRVEGNDVAYNNTCGITPYWGAGGSKWVWTTDLMVRGNRFRFNKGPGAWADINNMRVTYEYNVCEDNQRSGIFHEISYDAIIRYNTCRRNGTIDEWPWWTTNGAIEVVSSRNVEVHDNVCENNWQEITGLNDGRVEGGTWGPYVLDNMRVHDNIVRNRVGTPRTGLGRSGWAEIMPVTVRPVFDRNHYTVAQPQAFTAPQGELNWDGWRNIGQDPNGTFLEIGAGQDMAPNPDPAWIAGMAGSARMAMAQARGKSEHGMVPSPHVVDQVKKAYAKRAK